MRVSLYAKNHPEILDHAIKNAKDIHSFLDYVSDEFIAAEILLAGIYKLLKIGQVDTQSLGELTGSRVLMEIDPSSTKLKEIVDMPLEQAVKFVFDVIREVPLLERVISSDLLILCVLVAMIILLAILASTSLLRNRERSEFASLVDGPAASRNGSIDQVELNEFINEVPSTLQQHLEEEKRQASSMKKASGPRGDVRESAYSEPRPSVLIVG